MRIDEQKRKPGGQVKKEESRYDRKGSTLTETLSLSLAG